MKRRLALVFVLILVLGTGLAANAADKAKPAAPDFKAPMISLVSFEVPQYDEYWYYDAKVATVKGKAGNRGAPLPMSFVFAIQNPNPFPVLLEGITYTVAFDMEFDVITTNSAEKNWIPAGKTDEVRVSTMVTVESVRTNLALVGGTRLKERNQSPWDLMERWWTGVPNLTTVVTIKECNFTFSANGATKAVPFEKNVY